MFQYQRKSERLWKNSRIHADRAAKLREQAKAEMKLSKALATAAKAAVPEGK